MVPDDFLDDEAQKLFREIGVQLGGLGQRSETRDLHLLAGGIGGRQDRVWLYIRPRLAYI